MLLFSELGGIRGGGVGGRRGEIAALEIETGLAIHADIYEHRSPPSAPANTRRSPSLLRRFSVHTVDPAVQTV